MKYIPKKKGILFYLNFRERMNNQKILLTKEGLLELKKDLTELENIKRPAAVQRLAAAKAQGDLSENSEYSSALEELSFIDGRISELREVIKQASTVNISNKKHDTVDVGCKVTLHIDGKKDIFFIVGEWEANPAEKKISHSSPLGKALLGKKKGDKVEVEAPAGKIIYKILDVR